MASGNVVVYVLVLVFAASTAVFLHPPPTTTKKELLRGLLAAAPKHEDGWPHIAIGYNANVDIIAPAVQLLQAVNANQSAAAVDPDIISSRDDLASAFAYFFSDAAAGERAVDNAPLLDDLVTAAKTLPGVRTAIGGNAALMARQFAALGCPTLLGGKFGPDLRRLLSDTGVTLAEEDVVHDEYHVIMEYAKGDTWGDWTADRANRFIVSNDDSNGLLKGLEGLHDAIATTSFNPDALVVAGLHLLESRPETVRSSRLRALAAELAQLRAGSLPPLIHVELASVADPSYMGVIADALFPSVDSIGLNEQELMDLYEGLGGAVRPEEDEGDDAEQQQEGAIRRSDVAAHVPNAAAAAAAVRFILAKFKTMSRVHFHSLGFHILAEVRGRGWGSAAASAAAASTAATLNACEATEPQLHGNDLEIKIPSTRIDVTDPFATPDTTPADVVTITAESPVAQWSWPLAPDSSQTIHFALAPVLVCKEPKQTVGLGDRISATGLASHLPPRVQHQN